MAGAAKKWLIGCSAAGCLVIVLLIGLTIGGSAMMGRKMVAGFEEAHVSRGALEERFGKPDSFQPPADGSIPEERMRVFLKIREATQESRDFAVETFSFMADPEARFESAGDEGFFTVMKEAFSLIGQAIDVAPAIGGLFESRNQALLDNGMGMSEYSYIFVVSYLGALELDPGGAMSGENFNANSGGTQINLGGDMSRTVLPRVRREWIARLEKQVEGLSEQPELQAEFQAELERLQNDLKAWPWEEGIPGSIQASIAPFLTELKRTFSPSLGAMEIGLNKKKGNSGFTME